MRPVIISGGGLQCALGTSLPVCADAMFAGRVNAQTVLLDGLAEPVSMPWYAINHGAALESESRFYEILFQTVAEAIHAAGLTPSEQAKAAVLLGSSSFEVGVAESRYRSALKADASTAYALPVTSYGHLLARLRSEMGLPGEDYTFGTACAASANAMLSGLRLLQLGLLDHAIVIGLELYNLATLAGFQSLQLVAENAVRPFDRERNGMILGEACAVTVLSACDSPATDDIVVRGGASRCDTSSVTSTNTDGISIAAVITDALQASGLSFDQLTLVKAHATASVANDQAEANGLRQAANDFATSKRATNKRVDGEQSNMPLITALKPFTGHTLGACGVTECLLVAEAIKQRRLPATPGFSLADATLGVSPVSEPTRLTPSGNCLLNYFGFGGNNSVLVLGYG